MPSSIINRFSTLATDPLRSFRFYAEFSKAGLNNEDVMDARITSSASAAASSGTSTGWVGGFTSISGLNITTQSIQYREGGYNTTVHQVPGMTTFSPITFQRGVLYGNDQAQTWMRGMFAAAAGDGLATGSKTFRVNIKIYVMDHPAASNATATTTGEGGSNVPKMGFHVHNAWISTLNYSDMDAGGNNLMVETIGLVHEGLSVFFTGADYTRTA
jgi:phage tail-like protein